MMFAQSDVKMSRADALKTFVQKKRLLRVLRVSA